MRNAFPPLRCTAEIRDDEKKLRFRVFDSNDKGVIRMENLVLDDVRDEIQLEQILQQVRFRLEAKGFELS